MTVNEESRDSNEGPGKAALLATVILLVIYVVVAIAAQSYGERPLKALLLGSTPNKLVHLSERPVLVVRG